MWKKVSSTNSAGKSAYLCIENETHFPTSTVEKPIESGSNNFLYDLKWCVTRRRYFIEAKVRKFLKNNTNNTENPYTTNNAS